MHINERGTHTTVIEAAQPILAFFAKNSELGVELSPGKIEGGIGAKSKSIKLKHLNDEVYEMVLTHNGQRQEFKLFTRVTAKNLVALIKADKKLSMWNVNYTDMRDVHKVK
jgi:hypothetical protein